MQKGKGEKEVPKKKGIRVVDGAGRAEGDDEEEGDGGVQALFENQAFSDQ